MTVPKLPRDEQGRLIWDWLCARCKAEWTSGDGRCLNCYPADHTRREGRGGDEGERP